MTFKSTRGKPTALPSSPKSNAPKDQRGFVWENGFKVQMGSETARSLGVTAVHLVSRVMLAVTICFAFLVVGFVVLIAALVYEPTLWGLVPWGDAQGSTSGN